MNVPINVLRIPSSSRVRSHGSSPLALLATVGLALVLGVMAVVLLQGGPAQAQQLGSTSQPAAGIVRLTFDDGPDGIHVWSKENTARDTLYRTTLTPIPT